MISNENNPDLQPNEENLTCLSKSFDNAGLLISNNCDKCMTAIIKNGTKTHEVKIQAYSQEVVWYDGPFNLVGEKPC